MTSAGWTDAATSTRHVFGVWSFTRVGDEITDVTHRDVVLLRSVRAVLRDRDWGTVPVTVASVTETAESVDLVLHFDGLGARFDGVLRLGTDGDRLAVDLDLLARADFDRNRIGLVVLHPPTVAGAPLTVHSPDARVTETGFPVAIAPHQPALDIAALEWPVDGLSVRLYLTGDVFEMEDQRNWTDASFKTYSTPLAEPFPVRVTAGERIHQSLRLTVSGAASPPDDAAAPLRLVATDALMPVIGVAATTAPDPIPVATPVAAFLLVELDAGAANLEPAWRRALEEAGGLPLDVRLVAGDEGELEEAVALLAGSPVARVAVFGRADHLSTPELVASLRRSLERHGMPAQIVGGARTHFTELNRGHDRLPAGLDGVVFSVTPQMHAQETRQVVESIPIQRRVVMDALTIAGGRPMHVGPVTLRPRINAVATTPPAPEGPTLEHGYGPEHVADATDPRQGEPALTAWTIASAAALARAGVASISFFEASGPRGIAGRPVADAIAALHALRGFPLLDLRGDLPPDVHALAVGPIDDPTILVANLSASAVEIVVGARTIPVAALDAVRSDRVGTRRMGD